MMGVMIEGHAFFKTTDTALATFLIVKDCELVAIDYSAPRYEYQFKDTVSIRELSQAYIIGRGFADASTLIRVNKKLLRLIHRQRQWKDD